MNMVDCSVDYPYSLNELYFGQSQSLVFRVRFVFFTDGQAPVDYRAAAANAIARLNIDYEPVGISFTADNVIEIQDPEAYRGMGHYHRYIFKYYMPSYLNVFVFPNSMEPRISGAAVGIPGTSMAIKSFFLDKSTISHEFGHMFGLYHTHERDTSKIKNSYKTGDYICDTPNADKFADAGNIGLMGEVDDNCIITASIGLSADEEGLLVENIMSYSRLNCRCCFTQDQIDRIKWTIENSHDLRQSLRVSL